MKFRLEVQGIESVCNFRLSWGNGGEQLVATVTYPSTVILAYEHWREQYLAFYSNLSIEEPTHESTAPNQPVPNQPLRGKADLSGTLEPVEVDWRLRLKHAQETLRSEFQEWLSKGELLRIRRELSQQHLNQQPDQGTANSPAPSIVLLSCYSMDLERLPWEDWEIASEFGSDHEIRFVRSPLDIASPPATKVYRPRLRMLAILGDETGQDFTAEKAGLKKLAPKMKVEFLRLQDNSSIDINQYICRTIEDPLGWDILFFAGHSSESSVAGGLIQVAPQQGMLMSELLPSLQVAKNNGLHLAIFNSCSGLHIAQSLVSIGLSQVVIMREKIHGQIASKFLVELTQKLRHGQDSHTAFLSACEYLQRVSQNYPSAFLVPSLFAHPHSTPIVLTSWRWRSWFKQMLPGRREAIVLASCMALSVMPAIREVLLDQRISVQALYRNFTKQIPAAQEPTILLVQIDKETIDRIPRIELIHKNQSIMDRRRVMTPLVERLTDAGAKIIGFDYAFNVPVEKHDSYFSKSIENSINKYGTWFVFAQAYSSDEGLVNPIQAIANSRYVLYGCTNSDSIWHIKLPSPTECGIPLTSDRSFPFPYMLALASSLRENHILPQINSDQLFQRNFMQSGIQANSNPKIQSLIQTQESDITFLSAYISQHWLQPVLDYSVPPNQVLRKISAIQLINKTEQLKISPNQIVIIAAGGYMGIQSQSDLEDPDTYLMPKAIQYWRSRNLATGNLPKLTGGEIIAYSTYHFYNQKFLIPIPDSWMLLISVLTGKIVSLIPNLRRRKLFWISSTVVYIGISFQIYVVAQIIVPCIIPVIIWNWYGLLGTRRKYV
jgi:CHASE2 domain